MLLADVSVGAAEDIGALFFFFTLKNNFRLLEVNDLS